MYKIYFKDKEINLDIQLNKNIITGIINHQPFNAEIIQTHTFEYFIRYKNHSYNIIILKVNTEEKKLVLKINGKRAEVQVKDKFDLLLEQLGMDKMKNVHHDTIKAPMPGLVLNVLVGEGHEVKKGDTLLILEAMKMENAIKSPTNGIVKKIHVQPKTAVEKNQILIEF